MAGDINYDRFASEAEANFSETFYGLAIDTSVEHLQYNFYMASQNFTIVPNITDPLHQFNVTAVSENYSCTAVKYIVDSCFVDCMRNGTTGGVDYMLIPIFFNNTNGTIIRENDPEANFTDDKEYKLAYANISNNSLLFRYS